MAPTAHLTRLKLNPMSTEAARDLRNVHSLHRTVLTLAPDNLGDSPRAAAGILFRLEQHPRGHTLLIQSTHPLNLDALPIGYAAATDERDLTPLFTWCQPGTPIRYRIHAQPTRSLAIKGRDDKGRFKRGRRIPLHGDDATHWWHERATAAGLTPHTEITNTAPQPDLVGWKTNPEHKNKRMHIRDRVTRFEGTATITDTTALHTAITTGIGRGRAFGTGLLSIAPLVQA
ncbi:type I-E CRISPR-associated protein Cas6/Cse3/CasE [Streptomyces monashensis]|uniref:Type I-E CRISPR-associated protein Cas6/Cse3/CasE n=1 Tax=Streptomyces monashensis TaxID=1678012 RepID=A0A1S2QPY7_9ACTN|nr:type I-E CRISPR-associated protein Cas6/Cse3/CasE [Streptomyces monashensis]OIK08222.1 type I-E CRISPR-associated protein Cas6/Cse3/CasE [Streptomyces monashensis]